MLDRESTLAGQTIYNTNLEFSFSFGSNVRTHVSIFTPRNNIGKHVISILSVKKRSSIGHSLPVGENFWYTPGTHFVVFEAFGDNIVNFGPI